MIPKAWIKHGEIFSDEDWRAVFVCSACMGGRLKAPEELEFRAYDAAAFWAHVQKRHTEVNDGNVNREHLNKALHEKTKVLDIILIDVDDDNKETDKYKEYRGSKKDQINSNGNNIDPGNKDNNKKRLFKPDPILNEKIEISKSRSEPKREEHGSSANFNCEFPSFDMECNTKSEMMVSPSKIPLSALAAKYQNDDENNTGEELGVLSNPLADGAANLYENYNIATENMSSSSGNIRMEIDSTKKQYLNTATELSSRLSAHDFQRLMIMSKMAEFPVNTELIELTDDEENDDDNSVDAEYFSGLNSPPLSESNGSSNNSCLCQDCGESFNSEKYPEHLKTHERLLSPLDSIESRSTPLQSPTVSVNNEALQLPASIAPLERPLKCKYCSCTFCGEWQLNRHELIHIRSKGVKTPSSKQGTPWPLWPFRCNVCGKRTKSEENMKRHIRLFHTGESYPETTKCDVCGKLVLKKCLQQHQVVHTNKALSCLLCHRFYRHKQTLSKHIAREHPTISLECGKMLIANGYYYVPRKSPNSESKRKKEEQEAMMTIFMNIQSTQKQQREISNTQGNSGSWNAALQPPLVPTNSYGQMLTQESSPYSSEY